MVSSTGVSALLLDDGTTAHSFFIIKPAADGGKPSRWDTCRLLLPCNLLVMPERCCICKLEKRTSTLACAIADHALI